jgi:hypothetical protein
MKLKFLDLTISKHPHGSSQFLLCGKANSVGSVTRLDEVRVVVGNVMYYLIKHVRSHSEPSMKTLAVEPTQ